MRLGVQTRVDHAISGLLKLGAIGGSCVALQLGGAAMASAQVLVLGGDPVECAQITADAERLACYDGVFRERGAAPAQASPAAPRASAAPGAAAPPAPAATASAPSDAAPPTTASMSRAAAAARARANEAAERAPVQITVVAVRETQGANSIFTTDQGDVWIQTDGQRNLYPDPPFRAELRPGSMNSYFLDPADRGRAVRVRLRD